MTQATGGQVREATGGAVSGDRHASPDLPGVPLDVRLEVIGIPVSDVDAAKTFSGEQVGLLPDHDVTPAPGMHACR